MKLRYWLSATAGVLAFGTFSVAAQAAPLSGAANGVNAASGANPMVQDVQYGRRCYWHRGHYHCRRGYGYSYYNYPSYGPGFSYYYGRGHRHHHHHHHHRHHRR